MHESFCTHHVVITGAYGGIGSAIFEALAQSNVRMTLMGRDQKSLKALASRISGSNVETCDVTDEAQIAAAFAGCCRAFGHPSVLINCAGMVKSTPVAKLTLEVLRETFDVNVVSTFLCTKQVLPGMMKNGFGRIINVASSAALKGYPYVSAYCAAKHAVLGFTRSLAVELSQSGVTVNAICPGYTDTALLDSSIAEICRKTGRTKGDVRATLARANPQGRFIQSEEVASVARYLALDAPPSITGLAIPVTGGEVM